MEERKKKVLAGILGNESENSFRGVRYLYPDTSLCKEMCKEEFRKKSGLHYSNQLYFATDKVRAEVKTLTAKVLSKSQIESKAIEAGDKYKQEIERGDIGPVYIRYINNRIGFGLFTSEDLPEGVFIGEYVGNVRRCNYFFADVNEYCFRYPLYQTGFKIYTVDAAEYCNETSFMNHSRKGNCEATIAYCDGLLHITLITSQPIPKDTELTFDYGNFGHR